jgi:hypothetical protein
VIPRLILVAALVLGAVHLGEQTAARWLLPLYRVELGLLDNRFTVDALDFIRSGSGETLRLRANLAEPIVLDGRVLQPFGWRGQPEGAFQITYTVGGILAYPALESILVLAWPARSARELGIRLAAAAPAMALLLMIDVPTTMMAELWSSVHELLGVARTGGWMIWSRFLMGGGGYVIAIVLGVTAIVLAERERTTTR